MTDPQPSPEWFPDAEEWEARVRAAIRRASPRVRVRALRAARLIRLSHPGFGLSDAALNRAAAHAAAQIAEIEIASRAEVHQAGRLTARR